MNMARIRRKKIIIGNHPTMNGPIHFLPAAPQSIVIGDFFTANSGLKYNPIGGDTSCIFRTMNNGKIIIGDHVGLSNCTIVSVQSVEIGNHVMIGGSVKIYDTDFHWIDYEKRIQTSGAAEKPVIIKEGAFIGAHSIILKGVTIGERAVIGAGSVVTKDVPDDEIWAGNPAGFIKKANETASVNDTIR